METRRESKCQCRAEAIFERMDALCHCVWRSGLVVCSGMAASSCVPGIARNLLFSRAKWLPALMWGTWFVRLVRLLLPSALNGPYCQCCAEVIMKDWMCRAIVFGDHGWQFAMDWLRPAGS